LVDLIFPPTCGGCGELGARWCLQCQQETRKIQPPICEICGQSIEIYGLCRRCETTRPKFTAVRSWAEFDGLIRKALYELKFRKNIGLGSSLAQYLEILMGSCRWVIDIVIPVLLGSQRAQERAYNQAALIALPLALKLQLPYNPRILKRIRETQSQVELSLIERQDNLEGAFQAQRRPTDRKQILIIDDVTTSGSTLNACAEALIEVGAKAVHGLTIARAVHKNA